MYAISQAHPQANHRPAAGALRKAASQYLRRLIEPIRRHWQCWRTRTALAQLDSRTLRDIGLYRCEIGSVAAEVHGACPRTRRGIG